MKSIFLMIPILMMSMSMFAAGIRQPVTIPDSQNSSGNLIVVTDERQAVLSGQEFFASRSFTAATQEFLLITGGVAPRVSIAVANVSGTTPYATVTWYESASVLASTGTLLDKFNVNRSRTNTGGMRITHSPSALSAATTTMPEYIVPTRDGMSKYQGYPVEGSGWILKPNTTYFIRITPGNSGAATYVAFSWKE